MAVLVNGKMGPVSGHVLSQHGDITVFVRAELKVVGNVSLVENERHYIDGWHFVKGHNDYTLKDLYKLMQEDRILKVLELCPPEDQEIIRKDLEKYVY